MGKFIIGLLKKMSDIDVDRLQSDFNHIQEENVKLSTLLRETKQVLQRKEQRLAMLEEKLEELDVEKQRQMILNLQDEMFASREQELKERNEILNEREMQLKKREDILQHTLAEQEETVRNAEFRLKELQEELAAFRKENTHNDNMAVCSGCEADDVQEVVIGGDDEVKEENETAEENDEETDVVALLPHAVSQDDEADETPICVADKDDEAEHLTLDEQADVPVPAEEMQQEDDVDYLLNEPVETADDIYAEASAIGAEPEQEGFDSQYEMLLNTEDINCDADEACDSVSQHLSDTSAPTLEKMEYEEETVLQEVLDDDIKDDIDEADIPISDTEDEVAVNLETGFAETELDEALDSLSETDDTDVSSPESVEWSLDESDETTGKVLPQVTLETENEDNEENVLLLEVEPEAVEDKSCTLEGQQQPNVDEAIQPEAEFAKETTSTSALQTENISEHDDADRLFLSFADEAKENLVKEENDVDEMPQPVTPVSEEVNEVPAVETDQNTENIDHDAQIAIKAADIVLPPADALTECMDEQTPQANPESIANTANDTAHVVAEVAEGDGSDLLEIDALRDLKEKYPYVRVTLKNFSQCIYLSKELDLKLGLFDKGIEGMEIILDRIHYIDENDILRMEGLNDPYCTEELQCDFSTEDGSARAAQILLTAICSCQPIHAMYDDRNGHITQRNMYYMCFKPRVDKFKLPFKQMYAEIFSDDLDTENIAAMTQKFTVPRNFVVSQILSIRPFNAFVSTPEGLKILEKGIKLAIDHGEMDLAKHIKTEVLKKSPDIKFKQSKVKKL